MEKKLSLSEIKVIEIEILDWIVSICDKHNLTYYLSYGSLLGAVRHGGFIPWDDDVDISMPRKDYEKFLDIVESINDKRFKALSPRIREYPYHYIKVVDKTTRIVELEIDNYPDMGLWVDIFPLDNMRSNRRTTYKKIAEYLNAFRAAATYRVCPKKHKGKEWQWKICRLFGFRVFRDLLCKLVVKYNSETTDFIGHVPDPISYIYPSYIFNDKTVVKFEGKEYTAPSLIDEYLTITYGDYMKLPPESERQNHCVDAYRKISR